MYFSMLFVCLFWEKQHSYHKRIDSDSEVTKDVNLALENMKKILEVNSEDRKDPLIETFFSRTSNVQTWFVVTESNLPFKLTEKQNKEH